MKSILKNAKCPYCKTEYNSMKNYHNGVSLLGGEYYSSEITVSCDNCGEKFLLSVVRITKYSAKKVKPIKNK